MMLFRATVQPLSSFTSPLQSDTLFGAFCWSYKYLYGEDALLEMLDKCIKDYPQVTFSNAFPEGYLPVPMGVFDAERVRYGEVKKDEAKKAYQENKKYKKCTMIAREGFQKLQTGSRNGYSRYLGRDQTTQVGNIHNMTGRLDGMVGTSDEGGSLFVVDETFADQNRNFEIYILTELKKEQIEQVLDLMFELGIGGDKSVGKGHFKLINISEEEELSSIKNPNAYMALSNFIPERTDPVDGWYKTFVKYGKLDREYAAGKYPFKKPLLYLQAGAVFRTDEIKKFYGKMMTDISAVPGVVINACTIAVPMRIPE